MDSTTTKRSVSRKHDWVDERSRALHAAIAEKILLDPNLMAVARQNLARWMQSGGDKVKPALMEWKSLIDSLPLNSLLKLMMEESERGNRLRQSSPFTGILSLAERNEILARYESL